MITIIKASGEKELFSEQKLIRSIKRAGVPPKLQQQAVSHIHEKLQDNISTREIYRHITEFLGKSDIPFAKSRYSLKEAIMLLGPTGYPFEDYFAEVLEHRGFEVKTRQVMRGRCVSHEIDIIASKNGRSAMVEAKFHNGSGTRTNVHVPMYTKSRFDDVKQRYQFDEAWIVTNTKATIDAIAFAECTGMKIFSWSYPEGGSLRDVIEEFRLFPVTSLVSLTQPQKNKLLSDHVALCKSICEDHSLLDPLQLTKDQRHHVISEVEFLCKSDRALSSTGAQNDAVTTPAQNAV